MDKAAPILESPQWKNASKEERELIFARRVAKDPDYANADAETQALIRQRFGLGDVTPVEEPAPAKAPPSKPAPAPVPAEAPAEAPAEVPAEVPAEAPAEVFTPVEAMPEHIANAPAAQAGRGGVDNATLGMMGGGFGAIKGLLEKYYLSADRLQRDLYARSIKNVLSQAGINLSGVKDEAALIDMARNLSGQQLAGRQAQLGQLSEQANQLRSMLPPEPPINTGFPSALDDLAQAGRASGQAIEGESGISKWMRAMAGQSHQIPDVIRASAEDMTKANPRGGQALINKDLANLQKINQLGGSQFQLAGQGRGQLMLPPEAAAAVTAEEAARVAQQAEVARDALRIIQPQIATVEAEIARLTRLGKDVSQFTARLEGLRRAERTARNAISKGLNIPTQANISPLSRLGYNASVGRILPVLGNTLAGASAFYDIGETFDRASGKDPLGAAVHGLSAISNMMSMVPPVSPPTAAIKGLGILGSLVTGAGKFFLPDAPSVMDRVESVKKLMPGQ
jgi:hypothetical protein